MLRTLLNLLIAGGACVAGQAHAVGERVDVQIVDRDSGEVLTPIRHDGQWWIAGRPGARYGVAIANRDGRRTLNVLSVDGVNAMSGETAAWHQSGYVVDPLDRVQVDGWRKNLEQVAAFAFADVADSYAARTGRPGQVGVIGVAIFDEARPLRPLAAGADDRRAAPAREPLPRVATPAEAPPPAAPKADAAPAQSSIATAPSLVARERLGTAHGEIERSPIRWVSFRRAHAEPDEVVTIRYDRRENLIAMGIVPGPALADGARGADPFPASRRFVPDPPPR